MDIVLNGVRFSYLQNLFVPKEVKSDDGQVSYKYYATHLITKGSPLEKQVRAAIESTAKEAWGEKAAGILKQLEAAGRVCLRDGDAAIGEDGDVLPGFAGNMFMRSAASVENPPKVYNRYGEKIVGDENPKAGEFYFKDVANQDRRGPRSGDYGDAQVRIWAQDNKYGKRINCQLLGIAFRKEGEVLGRKDKTDEDIKSAFGAFEERPSMME